jgi:putative ABC transport system substrate-binding protein
MTEITNLRSKTIYALMLLMSLLCLQPTLAAAASKTIYAVFWNGCEHLCRGFQTYIKEHNIDAEIIIRDANAVKSRLPGFLEEARRLKVDLILSWGTSVTLGLAGTVDDIDNPRFNNDIAQVFTGVADPVGARIIHSMQATGRANITGTFNRVPEAVNITTIRSYMPGFKRLGLLYNSNEHNSVIKFKELGKLAEKMNFELVALQMELDASGVPRVEDIPARMKILQQKDVDFIYLGSSSFLDKNADVFTGTAVELGIPVLSPYERLVRNSQALLSIAARYYDIGLLAGEQTQKILVDGASPGDLPVVSITDFAYVVNMAVARKLDLFPSVEILQVAETVQ